MISVRLNRGRHTKNGDFLKRPRGKTNSKADKKHDAASIALQAILYGMMTQKEVREEIRTKGMRSK